MQQQQHAQQEEQTDLQPKRSVDTSVLHASTACSEADDGSTVAADASQQRKVAPVSAAADDSRQPLVAIVNSHVAEHEFAEATCQVCLLGSDSLCKCLLTTERAAS